MDQNRFVFKYLTLLCYSTDMLAWHQSNETECFLLELDDTILEKVLTSYKIHYYRIGECLKSGQE